MCARPLSNRVTGNLARALQGPTVESERGAVRQEQCGMLIASECTVRRTRLTSHYSSVLRRNEESVNEKAVFVDSVKLTVLPMLPADTVWLRLGHARTSELPQMC